MVTTEKRVILDAMEFTFERSTKNTHRYKEDAPDGEQVIGTLYVQKSLVDGGAPTTLYVTIEV